MAGMVNKETDVRRAPGSGGRWPIMRWSAKDAFAEASHGGRVQLLTDGHAEVWNYLSEAVGYLTREDVMRYRELGGKVTGEQKGAI